MESEQLPKPGWVVGDGVVTGNMTSDRLLILPARFWNDAKRFLENAYGASVNIVLNRFAREVGASYGRMMREEGLDPQNAFEVMAEMASVAGWGKMSYSGDIEKGSRFFVDVSNCAFCTVDMAGKGGKCDFIAGVAEGVAKETYGAEFCSDHLEVTSTPELKCRMTVTRVPHQDKNWKTSVYFPWMIEKT